MKHCSGTRRNGTKFGWICTHSEGVVLPMLILIDRLACVAAKLDALFFTVSPSKKWGGVIFGAGGGSQGRLIELLWSGRRLIQRSHDVFWYAINA